MEPWDGPSALVFTDGKLVGAALDRNGLRPCRFIITDNGLVVAGSEVGLADVDTDTIIRSGRLGPGQMILLDLERNRLIEGEELDRYFDDLAPLLGVDRRRSARTFGRRRLLDCRKRRNDPPAARLRLHPRRSEDGGRADGAGEQGSRVVHGRRHAHRAARPQPAAALRILPPALRAGHESAHRFAARVLRGLVAYPPRPVAAPARQACALARPRACLRRFSRSDRWPRCTRALTPCVTSSRSRTSTARLRKTPRSSRPSTRLAGARRRTRERRSSHPVDDRSHRLRAACCRFPWRWPPALCITRWSRPGCAPRSDSRSRRATAATCIMPRC